MIKAFKGSQAQFVASPYKEVLFDGTRGPGKTIALGLSFLNQVGLGFGSDYRGILFRRKYKELVYIRTEFNKLFKKVFGSKLFLNKSEDTFYFPEGETLRLAYAMYERDYENFHGLGQYTWLGFDELTTWASPVLYEKLGSLCRTSNPKIKTMIRATTNSLGPGHHWVKSHFQIQSVPHGTPANQDFGQKSQVIFGHITENPKLMRDKNYLRYLLKLTKKDPNLAKSWLFGSWDVVAGGALSDLWNAEEQILEPFKIPLSWKVYRCFDWGSARPFACVHIAESDGSDFNYKGKIRNSIKGDLFVISETYGDGGQVNVGTKETPTEVRNRILKTEEILKEKHNLNRIRAGGADTQIFSQDRGENEKTIADLLYPLEFEPAKKGAGSRTKGLEILRERLGGSFKTKGKNYSFREEAGLFFFNGCHHTIRTLPTLPRDEKNVEDVDTDSEDHIYDAIRYFLSIKTDGKGLIIA